MLISFLGRISIESLYKVVLMLRDQGADVIAQVGFYGNPLQATSLKMT
jgi:hypothetical protein